MTDLDVIKAARAEFERPQRSLIIDDDQTYSDVLADILEQTFNCRATQSRCCMEGIAQVRTNSFDFIWLDVFMPKINGPACFRLIRAQQPHAKVIFMSGVDKDFNGLKDCLNDGALRLITKTCMVREMKEQIREFLPVILNGHHV